MSYEGKHYIYNTGNHEMVTLDSNSAGTSLNTSLKSGSSKQKWFIEAIDSINGTYSISSAAYDQPGFASTSANAKGSSVVASNSSKAWTITPLTADTYRIQVSNVAWSVEDHLISLQSFDKDDDRQIWKLQKA